jgi:predicted nucleic acid-binding protein
MATLAIVDAGPLYAAADAYDLDHEASLRALSRADLRLVVQALSSRRRRTSSAVDSARSLIRVSSGDAARSTSRARARRTSS